MPRSEGFVSRCEASASRYEAFEARAKLVVAGVLADPTEGDDSALYEAFGYTRRSDRKSGLRRGGTNKSPTT